MIANPFDKDYLVVSNLRKLAFRAAQDLAKDPRDVTEIGPLLVGIGYDKITDGFWILDVPNNYEWYSPKFRQTLGYENEKDFPNTPASWQQAISKEDKSYALENYHDHINSMGAIPYALEVRYNKKDGGLVHLLCEGDIVLWDDTAPILMLGTHTIL